MIDVRTQEPEKNHAYLGDGVYAQFDGYHILLAANHHENVVIALEPKVMRALAAYAKRISELSK